MKHVKGRKEGKDEEVNEAIRPLGADKEKREKSQSVKTGALLKNCTSESKKKRREK